MNSSSRSAHAQLNWPSRWTAQVVAAQLSPQENALACVEVDLNANLHFVSGLLIVTDQRLLFALDEGQTQWQSWPIQPGMQMRHTDHAGVGSLSLQDDQKLIARWRFTLSHNVEAMRLQEAFGARVELLAHGKPLQTTSEARCPQCKFILEQAGDICPVCEAKEQHAPLSTWGLFRLWRFAGKAPQTKQSPSGQRGMLFFGLAHGANVTRLLQDEFALRATRFAGGLKRFAMREQLDAGPERLLQTHGFHVVREGETPAGDELLIVLQTQAAHPGMIGVAHLHTGLNRPALPLGLPLVQGEQQTLVCHNQEPGYEMQIGVEVNLHTG